MEGLSKLVATLTERMEGIEDSMKLLKRSDNPSAERPYDDAEIDINHTEHLANRLVLARHSQTHVVAVGL